MESKAVLYVVVLANCDSEVTIEGGDKIGVLTWEIVASDSEILSFWFEMDGFELTSAQEGEHWPSHLHIHKVDLQLLNGTFVVVTEEIE